jgi:hypothetical protein
VRSGEGPPWLATSPRATPVIRCVCTQLYELAVEPMADVASLESHTRGEHDWIPTLKVLFVGCQRS